MTTTPNYKFELVDFDKKPWHTLEHNNWRIIDSIFSNFLTVTDLQGVWENATAVTVGQKYVDAELGTMWEVLVAHTTASSGLFATDRTSNPTYWEQFTVQVANRGAYAQNTVYSPNDFVLDGARYGIVQASYTSDNAAATVALGYDADVAAGSIVTLVDLATLSVTTLAVSGAATFASTLAVTGAVTFTTDLTVANGGTGASTAPAALSNLGGVGVGLTLALGG